MKCLSYENKLDKFTEKWNELKLMNENENGKKIETRTFACSHHHTIAVHFCFRIDKYRKEILPRMIVTVTVRALAHEQF